MFLLVVEITVIFFMIRIIFDVALLFVLVTNFLVMIGLLWNLIVEEFMIISTLIKIISTVVVLVVMIVVFLGYVVVFHGSALQGVGGSGEN